MGISTPNVMGFAAGTTLWVLRDGAPADVAVEHLTVGENVITVLGDYRPIRWLGHRVIDCHAHSDPRTVWPIRIAADAFGLNRPSRDFYVSPEHSLCIDVVEEVLIPAQKMINGSTIAQVEMDSVTYWHVELEGGHDVLRANGMPTESCLETDTDQVLPGIPFDETALEALDGKILARTHANLCRPFFEAGPILDVVRERLASHAKRLGWLASRDVALTATADGRPLALQAVDGHAFIAVPSGVAILRIDSATFCPAALGEADPRRLGIALYALSAIGSDGTTRSLDFDDPALAACCHDGERHEGLHYRWTNGALIVPQTMIADLAGPFMLRLLFEPSTLRGWIAPKRVVARPELSVVT